MEMMRKNTPHKAVYKLREIDARKTMKSFLFCVFQFDSDLGKKIDKRRCVDHTSPLRDEYGGNEVKIVNDNENDKRIEELECHVELKLVEAEKRRKCE